MFEHRFLTTLLVVVLSLVACQEKTGVLVVESTPSGTLVSIDGTTEVRTPNKVSVAMGTHIVTFSRKGYKPRTMRTFIPADSERKLEVEWPTRVVLNSDPSGIPVGRVSSPKENGDYAYELCNTPCELIDRLSGSGFLVFDFGEARVVEAYSLEEGDSVEFHAVQPATVEMQGPLDTLLTIEGGEASLPFAPRQIGPGQHTFSCGSPLLEPLEVTVDLKAGDHFQLSCPSLPLKDAASSGCHGGWCLVAPGCFLMGTDSTVPHHEPDEAPRHQVCITRPFLMAQDEASSSTLFEQFGLEAPQPKTLPVSLTDPTWWGAARACNWLSEIAGLERCYQFSGCGEMTGGRYVCSKVQFKGLDCLGYRLPTDAEWEFAALARSNAEGRPDNGASYCEEDPWLQSRAVYCGDAEGAAHRDFQSAPNALGLVNMLGSRWEWVFDDYNPNGYVGLEEQDPLGTAKGTLRVVRGGSSDSFARALYESNRAARSPSGRSSNVGFRPVRTLLPAPKAIPEKSASVREVP